MFMLPVYKDGRMLEKRMPLNAINPNGIRRLKIGRILDMRLRFRGFTRFVNEKPNEPKQISRLNQELKASY